MGASPCECAYVHTCELTCVSVRCAGLLRNVWSPAQSSGSTCHSGQAALSQINLSSACEARLTRGGRWTSPRPCEAALIHTPALVPSGCGQAAPLEAQFQFPYDVVTVPVSVPGARHPGAC